jgi:phospholipid/cholesterol/gamma-HCH transport system substrate-binding protein
MNNADATLRAVGVHRVEPLKRVVGELPATLPAAKDALDSLHAPLATTRVALKDLRPGAVALGQATPNLRGFLRDSRAPLKKVPAVSTKATAVEVDLTKTLRDARPLLAPLDSAVRSLDQLLYAFAPYAGDAGRFFSQHDLLSGTLGSDDRHYFAAALTAVGLSSVAGLPDPLYRSEPYPCPGTAWNHATVTDCSGGAR